MSVPSFKDLGTNARDVFRTGYHYGKSLIKLGIKSRSIDTLEMGSDLRLDCDTSKLTGVADAEYKTQDYGSFLQKWTTDGTVTLGYALRQTIIPDIGLNSEISYNPETTARAIKVGAKFTKQAFNAMCSICIEPWGTVADSRIKKIEPIQSIILSTIVNGLWYACNDDLGKDLRVRTDEEEIERFANKYKARLENHPNSAARSLYTLPRGLQKAHPDDLTTTQYLNIAASDAQSNVDILGSIVTAVKGLLIGYQGGYNTETNKMTKNDLGLAFNYQDVGFHFRCTSIPYEYGLSLLYKVNSDWDAAINGILARSGGMQKWTLGAAAKCNIDEGSTFRCKFNTDLQLGLSLQQKLDENATLSLSFNIDCANVTRGGHKVGLAFEIEA